MRLDHLIEESETDDSIADVPQVATEHADRCLLQDLIWILKQGFGKSRILRRCRRWTWRCSVLGRDICGDCEDDEAPESDAFTPREVKLGAEEEDL